MSVPHADSESVPEVEATYRFEDIPEAMRHVETGHARAKIVVRITEA